MRTTLLVVSLFICLLSAGFTFQSRPAWEYKVEYHGTISEKKLNELAAQGWELTATASPGDKYEPATFIFRRAK